MKTRISMGLPSFPFIVIVIFALIGSFQISCSTTSSGEVPPPITDNAQDFKAVLFVGNSYTNLNSMPEMVRRMAASVDRALLYTQHAPGGTFIADHAESQELESKLASREWDFVTIQAQSVETALSDSHVSNFVYPNIMTVVDKIHANNDSAIPLYFMTWGRENGGDQSLCDPLPQTCTFEGMNQVVKDRYLSFMESTGGEVSPCAEVWAVIRDQQPQMQLYESDGSHPSVLGSYAVALSFYTMIFKADPTEVIYHRDELDANDEQLLREIVKEVVFDRMSEWQAD